MIWHSRFEPQVSRCGEALVVIGDIMAYDWQRITIRNGKGAARFPVRGVMDPGTTVFVIFGDRLERLSIEVNAHLMRVDIVPEKTKARPGEEITSVNGLALDDPSLGTLANEGGSVTVQIRGEDGTEREVVVGVEQ